MRKKNYTRPSGIVARTALNGLQIEITAQNEKDFLGILNVLKNLSGTHVSSARIAPPPESRHDTFQCLCCGAKNHKMWREKANSGRQDQNAFRELASLQNPYNHLY